MPSSDCEKRLYFLPEGTVKSERKREKERKRKEKEKERK
jgi:hypothetical protein